MSLYLLVSHVTSFLLFNNNICGLIICWKNVYLRTILCLPGVTLAVKYSMKSFLKSWSLLNHGACHLKAICLSFNLIIFTLNLLAVWKLGWANIVLNDNLHFTGYFHFLIMNWIIIRMTHLGESCGKSWAPANKIIFGK